jgi:hypothetical protein
MCQQLPIRKGPKEGRKEYTAFHPHPLILKIFQRHFTVLEKIENPNCTGLVQDVWVMRKKDET